MQEAHADGQLEAPQPGAAGVEIEHSVALFVQRLVRVTCDYHVDALSCRVDIQLLEVVQHMQGDGAEA